MNAEQMKPEEINIAIAEWMGPKLYFIMKRGLYYRPDAKGYTSDPLSAWRVPLEVAKKHEYPHDEQPVTIHPCPPRDCYNDLNAIHEAEMNLKDDQRDEYLEALSDVTSPEGRWVWRGFGSIHATAPQRCEALLRTIGKWKDE